MHSLLRDSAAGRPGALLVAGEAGVGKTSLVTAVTEDQAVMGHQVLWGRCLRFGADSSPLLPIGQLLTQWHRRADPSERERVLAGTAGLLAKVAPTLGSATGTADARDPARIVPLVSAVLDRIASAKPLVVVIDDVQWADGTSLDLLAYVMAGFGAGQQLSVLVTYRDTGLVEGHRLHGWLADVLRFPSVSRLWLGRLGLPETEELVISLRGPSSSTRLAADVFGRSGGNPYLTELLVRSPGDNGSQPGNDDLRQTLLGSWHRLGAQARELLQLLAVGGRPVTITVLERLVAARGHQTSSVLSGLTEAADESLVTITPDGQAWFHHPLLAEVVASTLTPAARVGVHQEYVAALESAEELSEVWRAAHLALHYHGGRHPAQAFRWSLRAADAAASMRAFPEELDHLHRACRLWDEVDADTRATAGSRIDLLVRASDTAWSAGEHHLAVRLREEAIALVDPTAEPLLAVRLRTPLHHRRVVSGLEAGPDVSINQAILDVAQHCPDTAEHSIALAHVAWAERWERRWHPDAGTHADAAVQTAQRCGSTEAMAWALGVRSQTRMSATDALADAERSVALAQEVGEPELLGNAATWRSNCHLALGRLADSADANLAVFRRLLSTGSVHDAMWAHPGWSTLDLIEVGRWGEARAVLRELLSHRLADEPAATARGAASLLAFRSGDEAAGHLHLHRARELAPQEGPGEMIEFVEVQALWACGEPTQALTRITAMMPAWTTFDPDGADELLVLAAHCAGDLAEVPGGRAPAIDMLTRIEELRGSDPSWFTAPAGDLVHPARKQLFAAERARCHKDADAASLWAAAVTACSAAGLVWDQALASYHHARALLGERGSRALAAEALRTAHRIARELGAKPIAADVEMLARQSRISLEDPTDVVPWSDDVVAVLTSREREVLSHVVAGRTYAEIAAELFISEKTVSVHISNLLRKTGTSSRIEVVDLVRRASSRS